MIETNKLYKILESLLDDLRQAGFANVYNAADISFLKRPSLETIDQRTDLYPMLLKTLTISGLLLEQFSRNEALFNIAQLLGSWSLLGATVNMVIGGVDVKDALEGTVHRPLVVGAKGAVNITNGLKLITLVSLASILSMSPLGQIGFATYYLTKLALSLETTIHAGRLQADPNYWLKDSLNRWIQMEKNIQAEEKKLESLKNNKSIISKTLLVIVYEERNERLKAMKLASFLLKKDITCEVAYRVSNSKKDNVGSIQSVINDIIKNHSEEPSNVSKTLENFQELSMVNSVQKINIDGISEVDTKKDNIPEIAKKIISSIDESLLPKGKKFESQVKEARSFNVEATIDFKNEHENIEEKNSTQLKNATAWSLIYGLATVGTVMTIVPFPPVQIAGVILLSSLLALYVYRYRETVMNTVSAASTFFRSNKEYQPVPQEEVDNPIQNQSAS